MGESNGIGSDPERAHLVHAPQKALGLLEKSLVILCRLQECRRDNLHQSRAGIVETLVKPSIEADDDKLTLPVLGGQTDLNQIQQRRLASAPSTEHADRYRSHGGGANHIHHQVRDI